MKSLTYGRRNRYVRKRVFKTVNLINSDTEVSKAYTTGNWFVIQIYVANRCLFWVGAAVWEPGDGFVGLGGSIARYGI